MTEPHDWHLFDAENNIWVRQSTEEGEPNLWCVAFANANLEYSLTDEEFNKFREGVSLEEILSAES